MSGFLSLSGEGAHRQALGIPIVVRATGADTSQMYDVLEVEFGPGVAFPAHRHHNGDEAIYVLEGELTATLGEAKNKVGAGSFVFAPRGILHGFVNGGEVPARVLAWQAPPPDIVGFLDALGELPPGEPDMEQVVAIMQRFDIHPAR